MKGLTKFLVEAILGEAVKIDKVVVVYSGRFQPFHKGHYATYDHLVKKFGKDNVFIGTSDVTDSKKSPFGFKEKKAIMQKMFGIPSNRIVQIKNPYAPEEILNKFDSDTTAFVTVVGEKDASRLKGKYFTPYKGKPDTGYLDKGYVYAAPAQPNPISGTDVRYWLSASTEAERKKNFMKAYPKFDDQIFKLITLKLKKLKESIDEMGLPGGAGVGLSLPGGYINGAPNPKDAKKLKSKLDKDGSERYTTVKEDKISGGLASGMSLKDIAKHHNISPQTLKQEFIKGYTVEREHTNDINVAKQIALDHLYEDPNYYSKLSKIETPYNEGINEISSLDHQQGFLVPDVYFGEGGDISSEENLDPNNPQGWESFDKRTNKFKKKVVSESLLIEGGAYGHMNHPFDIEMNLTFGDLKQIVVRALNGDLELAREKTDGQALAVSWVNGRLVAARNKSHLKNKGAGAMTIGQVADKFAGRGGLTDAYNFAMKDLSMAISQLSEKQRNMIFKGGSCFMNLEVIYPTSVNVIPYGQPLLVFHGTFEYDKEGNVIGENQQAAKILAGMIKQVNGHVQSKYTIQGPPMQKLPKSEHLSKLQGKYIGMITKLQKEFGLADSDGVADYHQAWWANFVEKGAKKLDAQEKIGLVKRWAFGDKSFRINTIQDAKLRAWAEGIDKQDQQKISKQNLMKFEEIFLGVGADVLSFMSSVLTANPESAKRQMVSRLESTIQQVKATGDPKQVQKLKLELQRLNALGGFDKIVPNEGIVFVYGGNTYKLTGAFAPLNQILGIFFEK